MTTLRFVRRKYWGADVWEYFFQPDSPVQYIAGQYASFAMLDVIDARGNARTFTLTSVPSDTLLSFAVKIGPQPSSYKIRLNSLKSSDTMLMGEPIGDLIFPRGTAIPLLFVAGGLGIASYISLLRTHAELTDQSNPISLLWALRSQTDQYPLPILGSINPSDQHSFIAPDRLRVDDIVALATPNTLIYLSGSEGFVSSIRHGLHAHGITDTRILFDYFSGYEEL